MTTLQRPAKQNKNRGWIPGEHRGEDFGWGSGDDILAAAEGTIVSSYGGGGWNGGWGNRIIVDHGHANYTAYNHILSGTLGLGLGSRVHPGQLLARMGETGDTRGRHLHFELMIGGSGPGNRVDPAPYYSRDLPGTAVAVVGQRQVRGLSGGYVNGRLAPATSANIVQNLKSNDVGSFDAFARGQQVTIDGVTSDIWYRGAFRHNWFAAAAFTSIDGTGLQDLGSIGGAPVEPPRLRPHAVIEGDWIWYESESDARQAINRKYGLPRGKHRIDGGSGPFLVFIGDWGRRVWVGSSRTNPPVEYLP